MDHPHASDNAPSLALAWRNSRLAEYDLWCCGSIKAGWRLGLRIVLVTADGGRTTSVVCQRLA